jgi:hypothetical protein
MLPMTPEAQKAAKRYRWGTATMAWILVREGRGFRAHVEQIPGATISSRRRLPAATAT